MLLQTFDFLIKTTSDNVLLPYRNQIIPLLSWNRLSTESKAKMAALLNFTKAERNRLFGEKQEFSLSVLARSGDKNAIKKLIAEFDSAQGTSGRNIQ